MPRNQEGVWDKNFGILSLSVRLCLSVNKAGGEMRTGMEGEAVFKIADRLAGSDKEKFFFCCTACRPAG